MVNRLLVYDDNILTRSFHFTSKNTISAEACENINIFIFILMFLKDIAFVQVNNFLLISKFFGK